LPPKFDAHKLASVTVVINGQNREIIGLYSNEGRHVEQMRAGQPPAGATPTAPAPAAPPAATQPS
jgi:hypothetical protein